MTDCMIIHKGFLLNGLKVLVRELPYSRTATVGMWINQGVKDEARENNGISHFVEHLLFNVSNQGGKGMDLLQRLSRSGAQFNALTGKEFTYYYVTSLPDHLPLALEALASMTLDNSPREETVEKERQIILQEYAQYRNSPRRMMELVSQSLWGEVSLGLPVIGHPESIRQFSHATLMEQVQQEYTADNAALVVVGRAGHQEIIDEVDRLFHTWRSRSRRRGDYLIDASPTVLIERPTADADLVALGIGVEGCPCDHPNQPYIDVISKILGHGLGSRLMQEVREKRSLVYGITSYAMFYKYAGSLVTLANCHRNDVVEVVKLILSEFKRMKEEAVSEQELIAAKEQLRTEMLLGMESSLEQMKLIGRSAMLGEDFFVDDQIRAINSVDVEGILEVAKTTFETRKLSFTAVGHVDEEDIIQVLQC